MIRVFIACSGLGNIRRGFESFFRSCYDALRKDVPIDLYLFKGAGANHKQETRLFNIARNKKAAINLGRFVGRSGYFIEQFSFFVSLLPHLIIKRPDVVYVSDVVLANLLRISKRLCGYRVLYCNGGPTLPDLLHRWDHIHQVSPEYLDAAKKVGVSLKKQTLLPHAIPIPENPIFLTQRGKIELRQRLQLPVDRMLLLSVGAINTSRKRMDYLIKGVASLSEPKRPYLLVLGAKENESEGLIEMGKKLLPNGFDARTVEKDQVPQYYQAVDVFTLASMDEGFGLVYVEALAHGLPCLVHDYTTARFVLGDMGIYADLSKAGGLAELFTSLTPDDFSEENARARHKYAYDRFSWDMLKPEYIEMFRRCADNAETERST